MLGVALVLGMLASCNASIPPHPDPEHYDQDCVVDDDCVAVAVKDCSPTGCHCGASGAINRRDEAAFNEAESRTTCIKQPPSPGMCNCVDLRVAGCREGTCVLVERQAVDGGSP